MSSVGSKFKHSDILIVGDSFCACRNKESDWPNKLVELLSGVSLPARGQGFGGCHWWSTRQCLVNELAISTPEVLILCHTDHSRLPSDQNFPLNPASIFDKQSALLPVRIGKDYRVIQEAAKYYYKYLQSTAWDEWTANAWYKELDSLISSYDIPYVIHLFGFENCMYTFNRGMISKEILSSFNMGQGVRNHFSQEANISVATAIADMITNHYQDGVIKDFNLLRLCK
jgi:hypothetical protein